MEITAELALKMPAPDVLPDEVDAVCSYLKGKGWIKASVISEVMHLDDRKLRAITEHSEGRILSGPGCPGYKLFDGRTELVEADLAACRLESQAKHMLQRAMAYRRRIHRFGK